ncbi:hypothetical protein GUITHDRAFT_144015 [Guillardia theta CCMP2712]|uniref:IPT/TIG domain-containing protein n=1 Tax=Guillardia theta (strain CCMP2712) TaxID=905079 RepID=L1ISN9_GUITC|nr:hypothetical protein GUITHDRAFT_144015 [Guillardia theta CCMP2712]EKX38835.1 hypothetical protein GUITHDRAFT_144015 [Guillardia theta CCMP2712]|eukprot:XP_005825815.1 hypothetical protein GUITHDRAFT_144015 [Guillardia theta CCMP2712]
MDGVQGKGGRWEAAWCRIREGEEWVGTTASEGSRIECVMPAHGRGNASLEVSLNGQDWSTGGRVEYREPRCEVVRVEPSLGPERGGTVVEVRVRGWATAGGSGGGSAVCMYDGEAGVEGTVDGGGVVRCMTPGARRGGGSEPGREVEVSVEAVGTEGRCSGGRYMYYGGVEVTGVRPSIVTAGTGTALTFSTKTSNAV